MKTSFNLSTLTVLYRQYETAKANWENNTKASEKIFNEVYDEDKDWEENQVEIEAALKAANVDEDANKKFVDKRSALVDYVMTQIPGFGKMTDAMDEIVIDFCRKHVARMNF